MELTIYQVDAFAASPFSGNPAAIVLLDEWPADQLLQDVAAENNLSETAYLVDRGSHFHIRWFTPAREVVLCGHATLAAAHVLYHCLGRDDPFLRFDSLSGELRVSRVEGGMEMDFPAQRALPGSIDDAVFEALGTRPREVWSAGYDLLVFDNERDVRAMNPDFLALGKAADKPLIVSAPGEQVDFVSRFFAPGFGINEDPVTGSAHCILVPYWSDRLGKPVLQARQVSPRGGNVGCRWQGDRVFLSGQCALFLKGTLLL